ncbi:hypothetical protein GC102_09405 [Paenibacillus sp. LMG 31460]|uniref:Uncharacterized protein n=1 Tax=Paenibacillus germinis TaxID=2654979 RepID=A0ABX1YYD3_9BACL|nr:hypothetical protein [Paenibacillus germinis]NOU85991.1 hypothetical protein [Paenibacillus germinis]
MKIGKQVMLVLLSMLLVALIFPVCGSSLAAVQRDPSIVSGTSQMLILMQAPTVTNGTYTLDTKLLGTVATTMGNNLAGLVDDGAGSKLFFLEANTACHTPSQLTTCEVHFHVYSLI